jgi:hypothetical protein
MSESWPEGSISRLIDHPADSEAYADGYRRATRELAWARAHGWRPTERQLTVALMCTVRVYAAARGGKFVGGQHPEWLHGRVDALRDAVRAGRTPEAGA